MTRAVVQFVGCGPGAADLLTLRAVDALRRADVVVWSPALLAREAVALHAGAAAELLAWPPATLADVLAVFDRARDEELRVVRLKGGDPALFGALEPEYAQARARGLRCEVIPGVSALGACAAALGRELATAAAPLLVTDEASLCEGRGGEGAIAVHGAGRRPAQLQRALLARGIAPSAPCAVAVELERRDAALLRCSLGELAETLTDHARGALALVVAGGAPAAPPAEP